MKGPGGATIAKTLYVGSIASSNNVNISAFEDINLSATELDSSISLTSPTINLVSNNLSIGNGGQAWDIDASSGTSLVFNYGSNAKMTLNNAGKLTLTGTSGSTAPLNIPHLGNEPLSLVNGDIWSTNDGVYARVNGATHNLIQDNDSGRMRLLTTIAQAGNYNIPLISFSTIDKDETINRRFLIIQNLAYGAVAGKIEAVPAILGAPNTELNSNTKTEFYGGAIFSIHLRVRNLPSWPTSLYEFRSAGIAFNGISSFGSTPVGINKTHLYNNQNFAEFTNLNIGLWVKNPTGGTLSVYELI